MFNILKGASNGVIPEASHLSGISNILAITLNVIIGVSFSLAIISMALAFINYVLSGGDPDKVKKSWQNFIYGFVAAIVTAAAVGLKAAFFKAAGAGSEISNVLPDF